MADSSKSLGDKIINLIDDSTKEIVPKVDRHFNVYVGLMSAANPGEIVTAPVKVKGSNWTICAENYYDAWAQVIQQMPHIIGAIHSVNIQSVTLKEIN